MEQHPIPRQITTFEFKLVGFMTLHQFIYLLIFIPTGFLLYKIIPIPFLNIVAAAAVSAVGVLMAFLPVNDRPLEVFLQNLYRRLTSPTQYVYQNTGHQAMFVQSAQPDSPQLQAAHRDAQAKLQQYLQSKAQPLSIATPQIMVDMPTAAPQVSTPPPAVMVPTIETAKDSVADKQATTKQPFFIGTVQNNKQKPLPEILVYVKNTAGEPIRLLKTNPNGVFATFSALPVGTYTLEAKDPRSTYLFGSMSVVLAETNPTPIIIQEKGLL